MLSVVLALSLSFMPQEGPTIRVTLVPESAVVQPGRPFTVGIQLEIEEGWHVYWVNPGESGVPTRVRWTLPTGWTASQTLHPAPERFDTAGVISLGHSGKPVLLATITPSSHATGTAEVVAEVNWLACKESCVPGSARLRTALRVGTVAEADAARAAWFADARAKLPQRPAGATFSARTSGERAYEFTVLGIQVREAVLFSDDPDALSVSAPQVMTPIPGGFTLALTRAEFSNEAPTMLSGVLFVTLTDGQRRALRVPRTPIRLR